MRQRGIELVARVQAQGVGSRTVESRPDGDVIVWQRPSKPRGMSGEQYRSYPESLTMRQVSVDAHGRNNRAEQFKVVTTILTASIGGGQIGDLYERRWDGELDIRSIKSTMKMEILRCKTPTDRTETVAGSTRSSSSRTASKWGRGVRLSRRPRLDPMSEAS